MCALAWFVSKRNGAKFLSDVDRASNRRVCHSIALKIKVSPLSIHFNLVCVNSAFFQFGDCDSNLMRLIFTSKNTVVTMTAGKYRHMNYNQEYDSPTCTLDSKAWLWKVISTVLTVAVIPSMTLLTNPYFPAGAVKELAAAGPQFLSFSQASTRIVTESKDYGNKRSKLDFNGSFQQWLGLLIQEEHITSKIGVLLSFVHGILMAALLQWAWVSFIHVGSASRSVNTDSSSSRFVNSPSPFRVLKLILSEERFFTNLQNQVEHK